MVSFLFALFMFLLAVAMMLTDSILMRTAETTERLNYYCTVHGCLSVVSHVGGVSHLRRGIL